MQLFVATSQGLTISRPQLPFSHLR